MGQVAIFPFWIIMEAERKPAPGINKGAGRAKERLIRDKRCKGEPICILPICTSIPGIQGQRAVI